MPASRCGFGDRVRRAEHDWVRDFPVNETARRGKHANVIAFRQNDLEMTTACCIETALDGIHLSSGKPWTRP